MVTKDTIERLPETLDEVQLIGRILGGIDQRRELTEAHPGAPSYLAGFPADVLIAAPIGRSDAAPLRRDVIRAANTTCTREN
ncbi:hypothetical protein KIN20_027114 [Parelaphostrongylus tenuis]|uniref:Uncharacterized protein n=1 Tax=Parelaphostrongylus tenuis TaxID=148309 RepID=A0AAD5QYV9_PARTN|nr:hypothetical protein KIN20_027114 [Parelaphostrongylus tenuis]